MFHKKNVQYQKKHLVVVADEDPATRKLINDEFSAWGMRVCTLTGAKETKALLSKLRPDLIILDVVLPDHSGLDLCAELRRDNRYQWVPIILMSTMPDMDKKLEAYRLGADLYIIKPFDPKELAAIAQAKIIRAKGQQDYAIRDYLTGLYSRGYFTERLDEEIQNYKRSGKTFCVALIDIDRFKLINDQVGHMSGDYVLSHFGSFLRKSLRQADIIARYGGEEFILLMPATETAAAQAVIERLRATWLSLSLVEPYHRKKLFITFSVGVAQFDHTYTGSDDIIMAADRALYAAKESGRNRIFSVEQLDKIPELRFPLILVVDDSLVIRHLLEKQLTKKGYRVVTAGNGYEALDKIQKSLPSLAVVDIVMPKMDGLELTRRLKEDPRTAGIRIVALTADSFEGTLIRAFHVGVDDYISKPFSFPELEVRIQRLLKTNTQ